MKARKIMDGVSWMGAIDWDRRLFDALIPLPDGTSYNAYLVQGAEKTALLDTVDPSTEYLFMAQLDGIDRVDYVVSQHAEQDHSGAIPRVLERYPEAKVVASPKCKGMLMDYLLIPEQKFITVEDGETLSLGGKTLQFVHTPWVHWPETMCTYLPEERILFTCDFFGSHLATSDLYVRDEGRVTEAAKRYYAEIMMPFRKVIQKNVARVRELDIEMIAPSHGPVYDRPEFILKGYEDWISDVPKNVVVLPYTSMHGSTHRMVEHLVSGLAQRSVRVERYDLAVTDIGKLAMSLVDAATIVIGSPTVLTGPHPNVAYAAALANALRPKARYVSVIGSYGWGTKVVERLADILSNLKVEFLPPVLCQGLPVEADYAALDRLADAILEKHRAMNLL